MRRWRSGTALDESCKTIPSPPDNDSARPFFFAKHGGNSFTLMQKHCYLHFGVPAQSYTERLSRYPCSNICIYTNLGVHPSGTYHDYSLENWRGAFREESPLALLARSVHHLKSRILCRKFIHFTEKKSCLHDLERLTDARQRRLTTACRGTYPRVSSTKRQDVLKWSTLPPVYK